MHVSFHIWHVQHVEALKLIIYLVVNLCYGIKRLLLIYCFSIKIAVKHWSEPRSYNEPFELLHSWDLGFWGQWSGYKNSFCQSRLLIITLLPCSLPFNAQVMILVGSSGFFNNASTSADGCYLYMYTMACCKETGE